MQEVLPLFRAEVSVEVYQENNETYLVLSDPFGLAEGPIMVHADMVEILERCDGSSTWQEIGAMAGVAADAPELFKARAFVGQLDAMGYFETEQAEKRRAQKDAEWNSLTERKPACAGTVYPDDVSLLRPFLDKLCGNPTGKPPSNTSKPVGALFLPHIDYRVAHTTYAQVGEQLRATTQTLIVILGTSHYTSGTPIIGTTKHFVTPLGALNTDGRIVDALHAALGQRGLPVWQTDIAHKPEHSIELPCLLLQHLRPNEQLSIVPLLVAAVAHEMQSSDAQLYAHIADTLQAVIQAESRDVLWLISGDLAHVGLRFGDAVPASQMIAETNKHNTEVLEALSTGMAEKVHEVIAGVDNRFNVCAHLPALVGLWAAKPGQGTVLGSETWDDTDTGSAVSFGVVGY